MCMCMILHLTLLLLLVLPLLLLCCSCYLLLALLSLLSHYAESLCMLYHSVHKVLLLLQHVFLHANALFITSSSGEAWM